MTFDIDRDRACGIRSIPGCPPAARSARSLPGATGPACVLRSSRAPDIGIRVDHGMPVAPGASDGPTPEAPRRAAIIDALMRGAV
jgi:hypothetical protein